MPESIKKIIDDIEDIDNDDDTVHLLQDAMLYFCSNWDICEGYKHAIIKTLEDQYMNHQSEQDPVDLKRLLTILKLI